VKYHGYVGAVSARTWKKDLAKTTRYISRAIELNARTDSFHRRELLETRERLVSQIEGSKTADQANLAVIESLVKLVFMLLGDMPDNWNQKSPYRDSFWRLEAHRSQHFSQSSAQKVRLLIDLVDRRQRVKLDLGDYGSLREAYVSCSGGNPEQFLEWFKREYPASYCEVF
jgi:hypothetical protein